MPNIEPILRKHVTLQVECIDRMYLQGYVAGLQRPNQLAYFLNVHRGHPLPSPALMGQMTERFVSAIRAFAQRHKIPIIQFKRGERKDDIARARFNRFKGSEGVVPKLSVEYKHSRLKQYFKEGRALRTETVINNPYDVDVGRSLDNLSYLRDVSRNINRRLLALERASHNCAIAPRTFESVVLPSQKDGKHVPGLRFGDPRTMAILAAICLFLPTHNGFTNQMLRDRVAGLLAQLRRKPTSPRRSRNSAKLLGLRLATCGLRNILQWLALQKLDSFVQMLPQQGS